MELGLGKRSIMNPIKTIRTRRRAVVLGLASLLVIGTLSGFAWLDRLLADVTGHLVGISFNISVVDNYGTQVTSIHGNKVDVAAESFDDEGNVNSSVIRITADGHDITQVGNTVIFAEEGLAPVQDFSLPESIETGGDGTITLLDRNVNKLKNLIGSKKTVVISSQLGIPIAVYQGDKVGYDVPDDLPKMTKITIDGKALYIHRANYVIMDTAALN